MNLYISSTLMWSYPVDEVIRLASGLGVAGVEVWAEHVWLHHTCTEKIIAAKEETGLDVTLHAASWDLNLCSLNEGTRIQSVTEIKKSMYLAKKIGANNVTFHPGRLTLKSEWIKWHLDQLQQSIIRLLQLGDELNITLSLELMEEKDKELLTTAEQMNAFLQHLPSSLKTTFDIAHVPFSRNILQQFKELERINKVHISDSTSKVYHVPLGKGELAITPILNELANETYPIVIEGYDDSTELNILKENMRFLREQYSIEKDVIC
ncbi:sugar phosphate isomerase/epimerase family protein [Pontibacillus litoralis]|uniref:Xylose isomerase-like TIM barrel domain-containing protein n=1 Tax=Pontibacillus litoralis JSM 072002 TaxID=1385512 RepID=A0A0A5G0Z3_9BACI|nr:sugar phosphate isomerase/epimerase family protein [Pontibacillus litoralis]KGX86776.1 hypothetical protein N784_03855 [Pontibacillus litoralis JSM 072002]